MVYLPIITYPNPLLKTRSTAIDTITSDTRAFVKNMFETMYLANGIGLAAVQVARPERLLVVDVGKMKTEASHDEDTHESHPICLINPEIIKAEGKITLDEGCLSCPDLTVPVERAEHIIIHGVNERGEKTELTASGLLAVAFQHELDHLNGKILVDQLSRLKRDSYKRELSRT